MKKYLQSLTVCPICQSEFSITTFDTSYKIALTCPYHNTTNRDRDLSFWCWAEDSKNDIRVVNVKYKNSQITISLDPEITKINIFGFNKPIYLSKIIDLSFDEQNLINKFKTMRVFY